MREASGVVYSTAPNRITARNPSTIISAGRKPPVFRLNQSCKPYPFSRLLMSLIIEKPVWLLRVQADSFGVLAGALPDMEMAKPLCYLMIAYKFPFVKPHFIRIKRRRERAGESLSGLRINPDRPFKM